jgi:hypothetical protein
MKVKCLSISGEVIPQGNKLPGETDETLYSPLCKEESYEVYGIMFYSTRIDYLISTSDKGPMWAPSDLFEVLDNQLPKKWQYLPINESGSYSPLNKYFGVRLIIGYQRLTESFEHYTSLLEREPDDINYFYSLTLTY